MTLEMLVRNVRQNVPHVLMEIAVIHAKKHIQQLQIIVSVLQELMTLEKLVRSCLAECATCKGGTSCSTCKKKNTVVVANNCVCASETYDSGTAC